MNKQATVIAIDGPSASGKSTVARGVAEKRGDIYVDSGSLYRGMTWHALEEACDLDDPEALVDLLERTEWKIFEANKAMGFYINGKYPGNALRSQQVADHVSQIAAVPEIRSFVVKQMREMISLGSLVIEGRDIGTIVFPETPWKFYLDADPAERARRRSKDFEESGESSDVDEVHHSLALRDKLDSTRKTAPLQIALGAEVINSTHMPIEEVIEHILTKTQ